MINAKGKLFLLEINFLNFFILNVNKTIFQFIIVSNMLCLEFRAMEKSER